MKLLKSFDKSLLIRSICIATILAMTVAVCRFDTSCEKIRQNVLRLHILANSNSEFDQQLKLKVRDAVLLVSEQIFSDCETEQEAKEAVQNNYQLLAETARNTITENNYDYPVSVQLADTWFETREYENFTLPAGNYEAVRIIIGDGLGKNWWCVMFPSICIPTASAEKNGFQNVLENEENKIVSSSKKYKARFKIVEIFETVRVKCEKIFK